MEYYPKLVDTKEDKIEKLETSLDGFSLLAKKEIEIFIKNKGATDPEVMPMILRWVKIQENKNDESPTDRRRMIFEMAKSDIYLCMGETEEALSCLDDVILQAQQSGYFDIYDMSENKITEITKLMNSTIK